MNIAGYEFETVSTTPDAVELRGVASGTIYALTRAQFEAILTQN